MKRTKKDKATDNLKAKEIISQKSRKSRTSSGTVKAPPIPQSTRSLRRSFEINKEKVISKTNILSSDIRKIASILSRNEEDEDDLSTIFIQLDESDLEEDASLDFVENNVNNLTLNGHLQAFIVRNESIWKCKVCDEEFVNLNMLRRHVFEEIKGPSVVPGEPTIAVANIGYKQSTEEPPDLKGFIDQEQLNLGVLNCDIDLVARESFPCDLCNIVCTSIESFVLHGLKHVDIKTYACSECVLTFATKFARRRHVRVDHLRLEPEKFQCPFCGKLVTDILTHANIHKKVFSKCDICAKVFRNIDCFTMHKETHSDNGAFNCLICLRKFENDFDWNRHISFHENARERVECASKKSSRKDNADVSCGLDYPDRCDHELAATNSLSVLAPSKECDTSDLSAFVNYVPKTKTEPLMKRRRLF